MLVNPQNIVGESGAKWDSEAMWHMTVIFSLLVVNGLNQERTRNKSCSVVSKSYTRISIVRGKLF